MPPEGSVLGPTRRLWTGYDEAVPYQQFEEGIGSGVHVQPALGACRVSHRATRGQVRKVRIFENFEETIEKLLKKIWTGQQMGIALLGCSALSALSLPQNLSASSHFAQILATPRSITDLGRMTGALMLGPMTGPAPVAAEMKAPPLTFVGQCQCQHHPRFLSSPGAFNGSCTC